MKASAKDLPERVIRAVEAGWRWKEAIAGLSAGDLVCNLQRYVARRSSANAINRSDGVNRPP